MQSRCLSVRRRSRHRGVGRNRCPSDVGRRRAFGPQLKQVDDDCLDGLFVHRHQVPDRIGDERNRRDELGVETVVRFGVHAYAVEQKRDTGIRLHVEKSGDRKLDGVCVQKSQPRWKKGYSLHHAEI
jgi:hypothetical protein